jgi:hypothetical protein
LRGDICEVVTKSGRVISGALAPEKHMGVNWRKSSPHRSESKSSSSSSLLHVWHKKREGERERKDLAKKSFV